MNKLEFNVRLAFTLAEVLITLGIIGIVAAVTIPTLMTNINQNVFNTAQDLAIKKIRAATDQMRTDDLIGAYDTNDHFVDQFQKYIKIVKRCDSSNLSDCFELTFKTASGQDVNLSDLHTGADFGHSTYTSQLVGIGLINGTSVILAFNPDCPSVAPSDNTIDTTTCLSIIYDTNGSGKPNQIGKDVNLLNTTLSVCEGTKVAGLCVAPNDATFSYINENPWSDNYWAGARDACTAIGMRLPTLSELNTLYANKASISGLSAGSYWSSTPYVADSAYDKDFNDGSIHGDQMRYSGAKARCVK